MKYLPINKKDIEGNFDITIDSKNTIPYKYYFEIYKGKVYRISKIGDEEWRADEMPFKHNEIPFIQFNYEQKTV